MEEDWGGFGGGCRDGGVGGGLGRFWRRRGALEEEVVEVVVEDWGGFGGGWGGSGGESCRGGGGGGGLGRF